MFGSASQIIWHGDRSGLGTARYGAGIGELESGSGIVGAVSIPVWPVGG